MEGGLYLRLARVEKTPLMEYTFRTARKASTHEQLACGRGLEGLLFVAVLAQQMRTVPRGGCLTLDWAAML